ncbi:YbjN domain-containing protein [Mycobacterium sp. Marseille-P9652]|uniref:YbjN domain-containing protein n=1 Tax=Mycobacterium sp. Marseille-P9652 TaxID=2654950 RepID=UPI0012E710CC|nr:YbjN domain-containing protein [Mycobacterium sp. Marseille-P9652]
MTRELLCANLIEGYLATSGLRHLRGEHEGEYFCVVNTDRGRLHVHLEMSPSFDDVLVVSVTRGRLLPAADRLWLTHFADAWNRRNRGVTALLHVSSNPQRIGIVARRSQWIREGISAEAFAAFVDSTIEAAIELFAEMKTVVELPAGVPQPALRDAG